MSRIFSRSPMRCARPGSKLMASGYINLDAGWSGDNDQYGRTLWNTTAFPHFLDMIQHIHANGQNVGIYLLPALGTSVRPPNLPLLATHLHPHATLSIPHPIPHRISHA